MKMREIPETETAPVTTNPANNEIPEPVMASDVVAAAEAAGQEPLKAEPDPSKTFKFDPSNPEHQALMKRLAKWHKEHAPKHENYAACHRKCPLFKLHQCFKLDAIKQKECYEKQDRLWDDQKIKAVQPCPYIGDGRTTIHCLKCKSWRQCMKIVYNVETTITVEG